VLRSQCAETSTTKGTEEKVSAAAISIDSNDCNVEVILIRAVEALIF